jgi:hypothetical protein
MSESSKLPQPQAVEPPVAENGRLITKGRIKNPSAALSLHARMFNDDRMRSADRAKIQQLMDNLAPVDPAVMESSGRGNCSNFNPGDAETVFSEEISPYIGLAYSGRTLFSTPIRSYGSMMERAKWARIIAEEATDMIRGWPDFLSRWQLGVIYTKRDGVAFGMHDDPVDWRWKIHNQEQLKYPANTQLGVGNFQYISMEIPTHPTKFYEQIKDEEVARALGYNIERARAALMEAGPEMPQVDNWEAWERSIKNNDYFLGGGGGDSAPTVKLIHVFCCELDGTVSHYITRKGDEVQENFIFKKEGKFGKMDKFLYPMIENLGSNGTYHAIRGVGHKIYSKAMQVAILENKFADMIDFDTTPIIQSPNPGDEDDLETVPFGYFSIFPNTYTLPERKTANYINSIIPGIDHFRQMMSRSTSKNAQSTIQDDPSVSRYVIDSVRRDDAQVSGLAEFLFYAGIEPIFKEVMRRITDKDYEPIMPGGQEAADFRKRCHERGVPKEALSDIDISRIRMNRVIGGGNENVRAMKLQSIAGVAAGYDPVGKSHYQHDVTAAILDEESAEIYSPVSSVVRLPDDAGIAQCENNDLISGLQVVPLPGQNDEVHCMIHIRKMNEFAELVTGQSDQLVEVTPPMRHIADHIAMHIGNLDPTSPNTKEIIEIHEQFLGMIENGEVQIMAAQEKAQKEAMAAGPQDPNAPPTPEQQAQQDKVSTAHLVSTIKASEAARALLHKNRLMDLKEEETAAKVASTKLITDMKTAAEIRKANAKSKTSEE